MPSALNGENEAALDTQAALHRVLGEFARVPVDEVASSQDLFETGIIDSLAYVAFISRLEDAFGVSFSDADIQSGAFRSIDGLTALLERKRGS